MTNAHSTPTPDELDELKKRLAQIERLADAIPNIVWTTDAAGTPTYFNSQWTAYCGVDRAATLEVGAGSFVHPEDLPPFTAKVTQALATGAAVEQVYRLRRASDGAYRWHQARIVPLRSDGGEITAWIGSATDIEDRRREEDERRFLVEASSVLGTSLELKQTLSDVAKLAVPRMADWCAIDLLGEDGLLFRPAVAHVDPNKVALAWELWEKVPPKPEDPTGSYNVIRTGAPEVYEEIADELLVKLITDPEILRITRSLGLKSSMCVPLKVRDRVIGTLSLVWAESGNNYRARDLTFAAELARRMAVAVDNARLYEAAEHARRAAEAMAADVLEQSRAVEAALVAMRTERDDALARLAAHGKSAG